jgi:rhodanese-related sulfurtransferase
VTDQQRILDLVGAYNFRDLGGYPTSDGRRTRWGRVFRSDTLQELTDTDLEILRSLGLATIVDLRTPTEVERDGRGLLAGEPVRYINLSVLQEEAGETVAAPPAAQEDMGQRYLWYLETGERSLATALSLVADDTAHPLVFHCAAGKDRTGVLAALVLGCLGVVREAIVADYYETAARLDLILARLRRHPVYGPQVKDVPSSRFGVDPALINRFLDGLDERHGGARAWARSVGVGEEQLAGLEAGLLEDDQ